MDETATRSSIERNRQRTLNEEAAAWLLELEEDPSRDTETRFTRWLESSADHIQTFLEVSAIDRDLAGIDSGRQIDLVALVASIRENGAANIVELAARSDSRDTARSTGRRWPKIRLAAVVVGLGILSALFLWVLNMAPASYETALGEQRAVKLDDGSLMHLNTLTRIKVNFTAQSRDVNLLEGEALFTVERDSKRPFRVITGSTVVQALGTQFNVYRHAESTTVSVVEGRVKVSSDEANVSAPKHSASRLVLDAGEAAHVERDGRVAKQAAGNVAKAISWLQRQLSFDHDSLGYVAQEFNRYNALQIRVADPQVSQRALDGVFNADEPQALLDFLAQEKDLRFERAGDTVTIHLRSELAPAPGP